MKDVITAGVDGTPESLSATLWAAQEAQLRRARLRLLHAWVMLAAEPERHPPEEGDQNYWPHRMMGEARTAVRTRFPDLPVDELLVPKDPLEALEEASEQSDLLVLGSRDLGPVGRFALGELGLKLVAHTASPTVLVRARKSAPAVERDGEVLVGLSLHEPCEALLAFAFDSAARRGVTLRVVHGRHLPAYAYNRGGGVEPIAAEEAARDARQELAAALAPWREKHPDLRVDERVVMESPAPALLHSAADAGLVVVGRRHRLRLPTRRIGHVVQAVVHHAPCPVAVVPHE
ncbi:universal stress protein [Streptomyces hygroscopicus]|uniref:universal stress protein n=1 Tax=Streptomyces hygroscopicus TaxID=1912 RepID=UPI001FCB411B|nr:universal stress protein [Streptomyces hygroscopicus]BDH12073.1 stress-inducible protein [Streptomyces hygroscopicus]